MTSAGAILFGRKTFSTSTVHSRIAVPGSFHRGEDGAKAASWAVNVMEEEEEESLVVGEGCDCHDDDGA